MEEIKPDIVFEVSWEVCNKVGGIYTVVKSKANKIQKYAGEDYYLIGPYFAEKVAGQFIEELPPENIKAVCESLHEEGIIVHYGTWLIEGEPKVFLIDFKGFTVNTPNIKKDLWDWFKIDSLGTQYFDYDEPTVWSTAAGKFIQRFAEKNQDVKCAAQFHEWLSGAGLLYLKHHSCNIATIFTTHATILGRSLAQADVDLYNVLDKINPDEEAYKLGIQAKYLTEKQSAINSDAFTTVSEITGIEAEHLLGRKPDVLLPNGLDIEKFPTFEENSIKHSLFRNKIREFLLYYFFPYYTFDIEKTLFYFIAGRYEFKDKGVDVYIKALAKLNERMKQEKTDKTVIAFIWVPTGIRGIKPALLENKTLFTDIKEGVMDEADDACRRVIYNLLAEKKITEKTLFSEDMLKDTRRKTLRFHKEGKPFMTTHDLLDGNDVILRTLQECGLTNAEEDKVKVVFYPIYLTGADGLLDTSYYESMQACHLGVFPSFYEPWGYTPLEAAALGVSSVTTDFAGFGRYICKECEGMEIPGVFVLERMNKTEEEIVKNLSDFMHKFANFSKHDRIMNKMAAQRIAKMADWKNLIENYIKAYNIAFGKIWS